MWNYFLLNVQGILNKVLSEAKVKFITSISHNQDYDRDVIEGDARCFRRTRWGREWRVLERDEQCLQRDPYDSVSIFSESNLTLFEVRVGLHAASDYIIFTYSSVLF